MPAIVDFPELVHQQVAQYGHLFANEPERRHFAEYLTGLYVAERKNVSAINGSSRLPLTEPDITLLAYEKRRV